MADALWQRLSDGWIHLLCEVSDGAGTTRIGHSKSPNGLTNWVGGASGSAGIDVILDETDFGYDFALPWFRNMDDTIHVVPSCGDGKLRALTISESDFLADPSNTAAWSDTVLDSNTVHVDPLPGYSTRDDRWYVFYKDSSNNDLRARYADSNGEALTDKSFSAVSWNPLSTSQKYRRPAGRVKETKDALLLPVQDVQRTYEDKVRLLELSDLSPSSAPTWQEAATSPLVQGVRDGRWNDDGMHTLDLMMPEVGGSQLVLVDGKNPNGKWTLAVYQVGNSVAANTSTYMSTIQSGIASSSSTTVDFDTQEYDSTQDAPAGSTYFAPVDGRYRVSGTVRFGNFGTNSATPFTMQLRLLKDSNVHSRKEITVNHLAEDSISYSAIIHLNAGQTTEFKIWQNSGDSMDVISDSKSTRLDIELLHPT